MNKNLLKSVLVGAILAFSASSSASFATYGALTLENDGDIYATDSLNDIDWLRWDQTEHLTYAQTLTAISAGGTYDGWSISNQDDAQLFSDALASGASTCGITQPLSENCSPSTTPIKLKFDVIMGSTYDLDPFYTLSSFSSNVGSNEFGLFRVAKNGVTKINAWADLFGLDYHRPTGPGSATSFGLMLYRDSIDDSVSISNVSAPFATSSLALSLILLGRLKSRNKP